MTDARKPYLGNEDWKGGFETREGRKVEKRTVYSDGGIGWRLPDVGERFVTAADGVYFGNARYDIFCSSMSARLERWVNVYPNGDTGVTHKEKHHAAMAKDTGGETRYLREVKRGDMTREQVEALADKIAKEASRFGWSDDARGGFTEAARIVREASRGEA